MKKKYKTLVERLLLFVGMVLIAFILQGKNIQAEASEAAINVLDYGACGTDAESDRNALNEALRAAGAVSNGRRTEVYVPPGTYYLDGYIGIYSNTWLHLSEGAKIVRMDGFETESMLIGVHINNAGEICWKGCTHTGYTQCVNVLVSGGEWSGGVSEEESHCSDPSLEIMSFRHAHDIEIRDTSIGDTDGNHVINLDGVYGVYIDNVYFHDHLANDQYAAYEEALKGHEVIHTDFISTCHAYTSAYPIEELPCGDIHVTNCKFKNCVSCIGTHNAFDSLYLKDLEVTRCEFENILFHCVNAVQIQDLHINANMAKDVSCFISCYGCIGDNIIQSNTISCKSYVQKESCIDICKGSHVNVSNNTIDHAGTHSISGANFGNDSMGDCEVSITGNYIAEGGNTGIYIRDGCIADVVNNTIYAEEEGTCDRTIGIFINCADRGCKITGNTVVGYQYGIESCTSKNVEIDNNSVSCADIYGISLYQSTDIVIAGCNINNSTVGLQIDASKVTIKNILMNDNKKNTNKINGSEVDDKDDTSNNTSSKSEELKEEIDVIQKKEVSNKKTNSSASTEQKKEETVPVYRVFNPRTGEHLYTLSKYERNTLVARGWHDEGVGWNAPKLSSKPVYRLYNPNSGDHHYTISASERNWLSGLGWRYEGICWYSSDKNGIPVYRHYHPNQRTGNHHYTTSKGESNYISCYEGWKYEGVCWYGIRTT